MKNITHCTRCQKDFTDFRVEIEFHMSAERLQEDSTWEYIPNLDNRSREVLCIDCFNLFTDQMSALNAKYTKETK